MTEAIYPVVIISPRTVPAHSITVCSDVSLDIRIVYDTKSDTRTSIQRRIESSISLPKTNRRMILGRLEFYFRDDFCLSRISLYSNLGAASSEVGPRICPTDQVWLTFPELDDINDDVLRHDIPVRVTVNRIERRVRLVFGVAQLCHYHALADGIAIGLGTNNVISELVVENVMWPADVRN